MESGKEMEEWTWREIVTLCSSQTRRALRACCSELLQLVEQQCARELCSHVPTKHGKPFALQSNAGFCTLLIASACDTAVAAAAAAAARTTNANECVAPAYEAACVLRPFLPRTALYVDASAHVLRCDQSGTLLRHVRDFYCAFRALAVHGTFLQSSVIFDAWVTRPVMMRDSAPRCALWWVDECRSGELVSWTEANQRALVFEPVPGVGCTQVEPQSAHVHVYARGVPMCTVRADKSVWLSLFMFASFASFESSLLVFDRL
jgi:hypothetical protein